MTVRIVLADDHSVVRQGLRMFLSLDPELKVVGEAANGAEAVRLADTLKPDIVLMDLMMPVMSGLDATAEIRRTAPSTQVIVLTSVLEDAAVTAVIRAGAIGYLLKDTEADELRRAIKAAAAGQPQLSPQVAARLLVEPDARNSLKTLTAQESQALHLVAQGLPDREIAARLVVDEPVVRDYFANILDKLRFADQVAADLADARRIQLSLLPESYPQIDAWAFAAAYQATRLIGGDLYDFIEISDSPKQIGLLIADVSGKGAPAALFMAHSHAIIRAAALSCPDPALALSRANALICKDNPSNYFVSAVYAILDTGRGRLTYAGAGHPWPLWWRAATSDIVELAGRGMVLGVSASAVYEEGPIDLAAGDVLVLYTDGITEAVNGIGEFFGRERLRAAVAEASSGDPQQVIQAILSAVQTFSGDTPQADDYALVAVKRLANSPTSNLQPPTGRYANAHSNSAG